MLLVPGLAGHAAQTAPRGLSLLLDWVHLVSGAVWLGGLAGLIVLAAALPAGRRVAGLSVCVPRFSNVALVSVALLLGSGIGATVVHLPILAALWQTSYGVAILVKAGLLAAAMAIAAVNLLRAKPRLVAARERAELGDAGGEASAPVDRRRDASRRGRRAGRCGALEPRAAAGGARRDRLEPRHRRAWPRRRGRAHGRLHAAGAVDPNTVGVVDSFGLRMTRGGAPVRGANVTLAFNMLEMEMGQLEYQLAETSPGVYTRRAPALVMAGRWSLAFSIAPKKGPPFTALVIDHATG